MDLCVNFIADIVEAGTIGSSYFSETSNSPEEGASRYTMLLLCGTQNYSVFYGTYVSGGATCMGNDAQGNANIGVVGDADATPSELLIGSMYGAGNMTAGAFYARQWAFAGAGEVSRTTTVTSPSGQNVVAVNAPPTAFRAMAITDLTNPVIPLGTTVTDFTTAGVVISNNLTGTVQVGDKIQFTNNIGRGGPCVTVSPGMDNPSSMSFSGSCAHGGLDITWDGINGSWNINSIIMPYSGYSGMPVNLAYTPFFPGWRAATEQLW